MNHSSIQPETASEYRPGAMPRSVWRRTLPGEYLSLVLMLHAGFGSMVWAASSVQAPAGLLFVAVGLWIVCRATGAFSQRAFTPFVTAGLLAALFGRWTQDFGLPVANMAIFSTPVFIAMLGLVLFLDLTEFAFLPAPAAAGRWLWSRNWYRIAAWSFVITFLIYMVVIPIADWIMQLNNPPKSIRVVEDMSLAEQVRLRSMEAMATFWFFALGATVGSFLNVVAYRMPRGESVVFRSSRCPHCGVKIKGRDNVPIFGWLLLDGRCRNCQTAISFRYPTVELVTAAIFLLLYFVELISGGANIPVRLPNAYHGVVWIIFYTKWDLVALYCFHCFALSALLAWTLIDIDCQRVPSWAYWFVGAILCFLTLLWPDLLPVTWAQKVAFGIEVPEWMSDMGTGIVGGLSGALLGGVAAQALKVRQHKACDEAAPTETMSAGGPMAMLGMIVGLSVGWQAALGVWLLTLAIRPITSVVASRWSLTEPPMSANLMVAYLIHLICWNWLTVSWWPSNATTPISWVFLSACFLALWLVNRFLPVAYRPIRDSSHSRTTASMTADLPSSDATSS